jgi:hypothetical protein
MCLLQGIFKVTREDLLKLTCIFLRGEDPLHFLNKMEMSITIVLKQIYDINAHISRIEDINCTFIHQNFGNGTNGENIKWRGSSPIFKVFILHCFFAYTSLSN